MGETVNGSVEYIQFINEYGIVEDVFIITFEGSKGKKQYWSDVNSGLVISVSNQHVFEDNAIKRKSVYYLPTWNLFIKGDGTENTVTEIYFTLNYEGKTIPFTIRADNVNYISYLDDDEWHLKNKLHSHLVYVPKVKPEVEDDTQGDPNHKVTKFREYDTNGGLIRDYTVDYLAEASFDIDAEYAPEWYQELGDNVKVILMGVTRNFYNINKQTTETFIRLQGDDGYLWFEFTQGTSGTAGTEREDQIRTELEWASLVSFDGEEMISDTEGYDVMYTSMFFTKDEVLPLEKIEFMVGSEKVTLQVDDFNCIGDSDRVYYFGKL